MSMMTDFRDLVLADSAVAALVGSGSSGRMSPLTTTQSPTTPYLTYQRIDAPRDHTHDGASNWVRARVQIDAWDDDYIDAEALMLAVREAIDGASGVQGSTTFFAIFMDGETDLFDRDTKEEGLYRNSADFIVRYNE